MCGGPCNIEAGATVFECDYCGTQQTLPKLDDERRANLYDRANHFRRNNEFDKAMTIYEKILNEDNTDSETYWSLVLCRYGIVYVEDPASHKRIPTINRAQFTSIFDDDNYKSALQYADSYQRIIYEQEAKTINEIQKGILAISQNEEPFDVFICYKESDNFGRRTQDSVLAQDLYYQLTQEGFKVFFSRITLEDKLGSAYEPYIFAALNSAKVMVALGTSPEYFNAVWVKNEWSRFLSLIKQGQKKMLIPAYKDMDPYDLPEEFSHLQAQDMSKLGFMQDLIRGIKKILQADAPAVTVVKETVVSEVSAVSAGVASLLKRAFMFLEDGEWTSANEYCEKVLDIDPECAEAYLGKLMAELKVKTKDALKDCAEPFDNKNNYQKVLRFADDELKAILTGCTEHIKTRNENARLERLYSQSKRNMAVTATEAGFKSIGKAFENLGSYKDSVSLAKECYAKAEIARLDGIYTQARDAMKSGRYEEAWILFEKICAYRDSADMVKQCKNAVYESALKNMEGNVYAISLAIEQFDSLPGWRDADQQILVAKQRLAEKRKIEEEKEHERRRQEEERQRKEAREYIEKAEKAAKKQKAAIVKIFVGSVLFLVIFSLSIANAERIIDFIEGPFLYPRAMQLIEEKQYKEAYEILDDLDYYKDSREIAYELRQRYGTYW